MSPQQKKETFKEIGKGAISVIGTVAASMIILSFTSFFDEREEQAKEIQRLNLIKADKSDVYQQIKDLDNSTQHQIDQNYQMINEKLDLIIRLNEKMTPEINLIGIITTFIVVGCFIGASIVAFGFKQKTEK